MKLKQFCYLHISYFLYYIIYFTGHYYFKINIHFYLTKNFPVFSLIYNFNLLNMIKINKNKYLIFKNVTK